MQHALGLAWLTITKMVDGFFLSLPNLIIGLVVLLTFLSLGNVIKDLAAKLAVRAHMDVTLAHALGTVCSVIVSIMGLLITAVITIPHFSMASVIGGLGISSVAIGFAFKDILQNFFAGMLLLWQKPFKIGDEIRTQSFEGRVEDIRIRFTLLRTFDGEMVLIPNGDIYTNPVTVTNGKRKFHLTLAPKNYGSLQAAKQKIRDVIVSTEGVLDKPEPAIYVSDVDSDPPKLDVYFWAKANRDEMLSTIDTVASRLRDSFKVTEQPKETAEPASEAAQVPAKEPQAAGRPGLQRAS